VKLPAFEPGQLQAWPPPQNLDPLLFAPVPHDPRYPANWGVALEEQARAKRDRHEREAAEGTPRAARRGEWWARGRVSEQQRMADYYARLTWEQQERYYAEVRERR
jgi:hypothetical protein